MWKNKKRISSLSEDTIDIDVLANGEDFTLDISRPTFEGLKNILNY